MKWHIFGDNNDLSYDYGLVEWWEVMDSDSQFNGKETRKFKCESKQDAEWLARVLNNVHDLDAK